MSILDRKIKLRTLLDIVIYVTFCIIILVQTLAIINVYIDNADARFEIQKRDVTIEALIMSCKMDWLIYPLEREE